MTAATTTRAIHPFERAGLGKAPFRFVGMVKQDLCHGEVILNRAEYERTGIATTTKRGGSCDYCGTGIHNMYGVESSDGRRFKVGCDCIRKVAREAADTDMERALRRAEAPARRAKAAKAKARRAAKAAEVKAELTAALADPATRSRLEGCAHPNRWRAEKGDTLLDWAEWMVTHSGATGRAKTLKAIKSARAV